MSKHKRINGVFAARTIEMLRSPAMGALSLTGRRILDRIEIELAAHGGNDNGKLPVTHADFRQFGIDHNAVGAGIREVCALGFVRLTRRGRTGIAGHRCPSLFEITYRPVDEADPIDTWRKIATVEQAEKIAAKARAHKPRQNRRLKLNGNHLRPQSKPAKSLVLETRTNLGPGNQD